MADLAMNLRRAGPLAGRCSVSVGLVPPATRFNFRGSPEAAALCGEAFGCALPLKACSALDTADRAALWLGPDEWLLLAPEADLAGLTAAIAKVLGAVPHSLVDISHRQVGFELRGAEVEPLLNAGCPLDLSLKAFPIGMATRTLLAKADIALWRRGADLFHLEVNRSFAPYVRAFLQAAAAGVVQG